MDVFSLCSYNLLVHLLANIDKCFDLVFHDKLTPVLIGFSHYLLIILILLLRQFLACYSYFISVLINLFSKIFHQ